MNSGTPALPSPNLQLLLAQAEDHRPVLEQGLEAKSLLNAPKPPVLPGRLDVPAWESPDGDRNDLAAQRWGVIAPEGVMLSVTHGRGRPDAGWASSEEQFARQGALLLGPDQELTGALLRNTPFLPGGMWFSVACHGAATPATSAFHAWLTQISQGKVWADQASAVLWNLPREGERPFVAALPQALLANEQGPLAIIGHSELARCWPTAAVRA